MYSRNGNEQLGSKIREKMGFSKEDAETPRS